MAPGDTKTRGVHLSFFGVGLLCALVALFSERGGDGEAIGTLAGLATLCGWGWYAGPWCTFRRAGEPAWFSALPFYNGVVLCRIAGLSGWWMPLWLVPGAQLLLGVSVLSRLSKDFGRSPLLPVLLSRDKAEVLM